MRAARSIGEKPLDARLVVSCVPDRTMQEGCRTEKLNKVSTIRKAVGKHTHGTSFIRVSAADLDWNGGSAGTCLDGMCGCELYEVRDADLFLVREIAKVAA